MNGFTLWFTGLPGAGKTTLAQAVAQALRQRGITRIEVLDGDMIRTNLSQGLGFSRADRETNIRRIAFVCQLLTRNDVVAIAALVSPYRASRDDARKEIGRFVEVRVKCPDTFFFLRKLNCFLLSKGKECRRDQTDDSPREQTAGCLLMLERKGTSSNLLKL